MKNILRRPTAHFGHAGQENLPNHMKHTFSSAKNVNTQGFLGLSSMMGSSLRNITKTIENAGNTSLAALNSSEAGERPKPVSKR